MALFLLLWVSCAGALLARRLDPDSSRPVDALALGAALGLALFAACGFVLGWAFGLSAATVIAAAILTMATGAGFGARPAALWSPAHKRPSPPVLALAALTFLLVFQLADRTLFVVDDAIATGDRHNFGDLPFHMAIAAGFAWGDNFPPDHPELAGAALTYPFFCDLLSGMILAAGGTWRDAFFWPTFLLGLSVVVALVRFGEAITRSRALGRVTAALTCFSGGLGFLALTSAAEVSRFWTTPFDLTINDAGIRYANFIVTLFIPQRSILFGWPLLLFALALLVESLRKNEGTESSKAEASSSAWLRAGLLVSLLPLVHAHSFLIFGLCALCFAARAGRSAVIGFVKGVTPLAAPAILFMLTHNSLSTGQFFEWQPGFDGGSTSPLRYWLSNAGLFLPLAIFGIARAASPATRFLALPFASLFVIANLFRLSPWIWDNMKFLAPAHAGLAPFAALAIGLAWKHGRMGKFAAALAFAVASLSGALDIAKVAMAGGQFRIFDRTALEFAERVREAAPPETTILTAPTHNHPVLLSGRRVFLGYEGHLWSQGLDYLSRKPVADALFRGEWRAAATSPFLSIEAIAVTPAEAALISDPGPLEGLPSLVDSPYRLLKIR